MTRYSIHQGGRCVQVGTCADEDLPRQWVPEGGEIRCGEEAQAELDPLPPRVLSFEGRREALILRLAARRKQVETGGTTAGGVPVFTDDSSQAKLTGLLVVAGVDPGLEVDWKGSDGHFYKITAAQVPVIVGAVFAHIQAAFSREAAFKRLLQEASTDARLEELAAQIEAWAEPV